MKKIIAVSKGIVHMERRCDVDAWEYAVETWTLGTTSADREEFEDK